MNGEATQQEARCEQRATSHITNKIKREQNVLDSQRIERRRTACFDSQRDLPDIHIGLWSGQGG